MVSWIAVHAAMQTCRHLHHLASSSMLRMSSAKTGSDSMRLRRSRMMVLTSLSCAKANCRMKRCCAFGRLIVKRWTGEEVKGGHQSCRRWWSVPKGNAPPPRYGVPHPPLRNLGAEKETSPLFVPRLWLVQCVGMSDNHEERFLGPRPSESHGCQR